METVAGFAKLNRNNYKTWKEDVVCLLAQEGVKKWIVKSTQPVLPVNHSFSDGLKYDQLKERAIGLLKSACDSETRQIIANVEDPADAWNLLSQAFESSSRARKAYLLTEYMNVKINPQEPMSVFIARFEAAYRKVEEADEEISEEQRCYQLIRYLPDSFDGLVREIYSLSKENFTFANIKEKLLTEDGRRSIKEQEREANENVFAATSNLKQSGNRTFLGKNKDQRKCFNCGRPGHFARNCDRRKSQSLRILR